MKDKLTGIEKAAILFLSAGEKISSQIFSMLSDEEIKAISQAMSNLGNVKQDSIEQVLMEFNDAINTTTPYTGDIETTEKLLLKVLSGEKVSSIMEDIRGPAGRNTWDKLGNINEQILANFLKNEHPQTVALIISKMNPQHAARVLSILPEDMSFDIIMRVINMNSVKKEIVDNVEKTLRSEFIGNLSKTQKNDANTMMAEIFNNFDRTNEARYMGKLETQHPDVAEKIKKLMFTFEDLIKVQATGIQTILRVIDRNVLTLAMKGASQPIKDLFLGNMSQRAAKILIEEIQALGPVKVKDVDESQTTIINKVKELAARGEVIITDTSSTDDVIY